MNATDQQALQAIEKALNIKLEKLDKLDWKSKGYVLNEQGKVRGLGLYQCKIQDLNCIIAPLKDLRNLSSLYLSNNQISELSGLKDLSLLSRLDLSSNQIRELSGLKDLNNLSSLWLSSNEISELSGLKDLKQLTELDLSDNEIIELSGLKDLSNLSKLWLSRNQIIELSGLKDLSNLTKLYLYNNQIRELSGLKDLSLLSKLDLGYNQIRELSTLKELRKLQTLFLDGNPIETPPYEIAIQGIEAIRNYFKQLEVQGTDTIYEAKLMLVGEPGAGKTSLSHKLFDKDYPLDKNEKSTLGVTITPNLPFTITIANSDKPIDFKAHVWDFGGQEIQYMLHQFFLTSDCLYILMAEKRRELKNFDYWLNILNVLAQNSPILVTLNEINIDNVADFSYYDERKYVELFPKLKLKKLEVNLAEINDGRFDVLQNAIQTQLAHLEHIGKPVPAKWVDIRQALEHRRARKYIPIEEYYRICYEQEITQIEDQKLILKYFHLLGIVLHFAEDYNLRNTVFLDPNWVVDAIYTVLVDNNIVKNNGLFTQDTVDKIWDKKGYNSVEKANLLNMMLKDKFELCYKRPYTENAYIVPLLLPNQKPKYDWDNIDNLQFRFQYPFMPKGIVSRLIVRLNEYIDNNLIWDEGAVFNKGETRAQVIERKTADEGLKIIEIRLQGEPNSRKEFLTLLREHIKQIQDISFPNLPYLEMVPCNCGECGQLTSPHFFKYEDIEICLKKGKNTIECRKSVEDVEINKLIDAIGFKIMETDRRKGDTIVHNYGTIQGSNLNTGDGNRQTIVPAQTEQADPEDKIIKKQGLNYQRYALIITGTIALAAVLTFIFKALEIF